MNEVKLIESVSRSGVSIITIELDDSVTDPEPIWSDIRAMPMMHNTQIGDMQSGLSGGQRQRIILARAFYRRPRILLLDEATSHLDRINEQLVFDSIRSIGVTTISVTHRPDVLRRADRIIQLV